MDYTFSSRLPRDIFKSPLTAKAQCDTIRLKLFKIGARIRITVRKVWIAYAGGYPYKGLFAHILMNIMKIPLRI